MYNIILEESPERLLGLMMGCGSFVTAAAPAIGPTFGGIMTQYFTWRYIFICVLPVIVLASFIGYFCMSEQIINKHEKFDLLSFIAVALAFVSLIMGFSNLNQIVDDLVFVLGCFIIGIISLYYFTKRQLHIKNSLIRIEIFNHKGFTFHTLAIMFLQMTTLGYIETRESYLMLHRVKKEQDVNEGKWIGIGGKFEYGESPEECMIREAKEETGLAVTSMKFRGILTFICDKQDPEYICLYTIDGFSGQLKECDEGELLWVPKDEIFGLNLWEGDRIFFDLLQKDVPFFSLKLCYEGDQLLEAVLNGEKELVGTAKV